MILLITYYNLKITEITLVLMDLSHPTPSLVKVAVLHRSAVQYNFKHFNTVSGEKILKTMEQYFTHTPKL